MIQPWFVLEYFRLLQTTCAIEYPIFTFLTCAFLMSCNSDVEGEISENRLSVFYVLLLFEICVQNSRSNCIMEFDIEGESHMFKFLVE